MSHITTQKSSLFLPRQPDENPLKVFDSKEMSLLLLLFAICSTSNSGVLNRGSINSNCIPQAKVHVFLYGRAHTRLLVRGPGEIGTVSLFESNAYENP